MYIHSLPHCEALKLSSICVCVCSSSSGPGVFCSVEVSKKSYFMQTSRLFIISRDESVV